MVPPVEPMREPTLPCEQVNLTIAELRPSVTLLVDQSGSMRSGYPERESPQTRSVVVRQALLDPMTGVVPTLQQSLLFGLVFYTSHNGFSGGACPILNTVRAATDNFEAIHNLWQGLLNFDCGGQAPEREHFLRVAAQRLRVSTALRGSRQRRAALARR